MAGQVSRPRGGDDQLENARQVADQLPIDDPNRLAMRIAPRTLLCGNAWRIGGTVADTGFDELRELTVPQVTRCR